MGSPKASAGGEVISLLSSSPVAPYRVVGVQPLTLIEAALSSDEDKDPTSNIFTLSSDELGLPTDKFSHQSIENSVVEPATPLRELASQDLEDSASIADEATDSDSAAWSEDDYLFSWTPKKGSSHVQAFVSTDSGSRDDFSRPSLPQFSLPRRSVEENPPVHSVKRPSRAETSSALSTIENRDPQLPRAKKTKSVASSRTVVRKGQDRRGTVKQMICEIATIEHSHLADALANGLKELGAMATVSQSLPALSSAALVIRLSRLVSDIYDGELDAYVPVPEHSVDENTSIVILNAEKLTRVLAGPKEAQSDYARRLADEFPGKPYFLVQGLTNVVKKALTRYNRELQKHFRALVSEGCAPAASLERPSEHAAFIQGQVKMQARFNVKVIYAPTENEAAQWVQNLIQDVSLAKYRSLASPVLSSRSSKDVTEATVEALCNTGLVPPTVAKRIQNAHKTFSTLLSATCVSSDGTRSLERIQGVSVTMEKALYTLFSSDDPLRTI